MAKEYFVGVDLGGTSMRAGVVTKSGEVVALEKRKTRPELGATAVIGRLAKTIERAIKSAEIKKKDVRGIGIGVPGPIDAEEGIVRVAVNLGKEWNNVPLGKNIRDATGIEVYLDNDVRCGAVGEHAHGAGMGIDDMVAVFVGTGIGGGIILGGELRNGFRGGAGEIGHTVVAAGNGIMGKTGGDGTVEPIASRTGMESYVQAQVRAGRKSVVPTLMADVGGGRLTSRVIAEALKKNDKVMAEAIAISQNILGLLAANLVNTLDPQLIVFGGGVTERLGEKFIAPIRKVAYAHFVNKQEAKKVGIVAAKLKDASGVVGAAVLARRHLS